ncbi:hypothetical protein ACFVFH_06020 [Streptomyces sp. NPDC057697]|uniref:hypothetical protein n=1 Tax=Streptomyces sp. NPDC057697 TaxID=3346219 RepID=UPI0036A95DAD
MRRAHRSAAGLLLVGALLTTTGCAQSVDPIERLGRKAAQRVNRPPEAPVHGDHGGAGSLVVIACRRPPETRRSRPSPPLRHWWPARPGSYEGTGTGTGCGRP